MATLSPYIKVKGFKIFMIMRHHVFLILTIIGCALSWPTTSCNAQTFAKAARSAFHSIRANKALVTTKAARDYTIQERQRRQIQQRVAFEALPPVSPINHMRLPNVKPISTATLKAVVIPKQLSVLLSPVRIDSLNSFTHSIVTEESLSDSTIVDINNYE